MSSWPTTRKRPPGRHTILIDGADGPGGDDPGGYTGMAGRSGLGGAGTQVWIRGEHPAAGLRRPVPPRPWYRRRWRWLTVAAGLAAIAWVSFLEVPPLLAAVGIGAPGGCQLCQLPIPSSAAAGPGTGSSPAMPATAPPPARTAIPSASASPPVRVAATPSAAAAPGAPGTSPPTVSATYTAAPAGGGGFTGQVTVTNRGTAAITGWHLVVALPGDTVSAVQNAEFTDDHDTLVMTPAPYDLSIGAGRTATITIYATGPDRAPAECSFDTVSCR